MKYVYLSAAAAIALSLGGCATSVSAPTAVQPLATDSTMPLHISDVSADAASGVQVGDADLGLICQKVKAYMKAQSPAVMVDAGTPSAYQMKIHMTRFDRGNSFARFMLVGLGQIHIEGTVDLDDSSGKSVAQYKVVKDFALGGVAGGTTTVEDVEEGFAKSVAEIAKGKS
ncbi:MAG: DUF4410 domain-containing protein [Rhizomicrobium sp.]|jgi:hypothetical protein